MTSVIIIGFDGLQPAQTTPEKMPNLSAFFDDGVTFENHHSVYPTVTRVNVTSILTGFQPGGHGLSGNRLVVRDYDPNRSFGLFKPDLEDLFNKTGRVLLGPHLGDILAEQDLEMVGVCVGGSGNAFLHNPNAERVGGVVVHPDFTLPRSLHKDISARLGPWPTAGNPNGSRMEHAVDVLTEYVLPEREPAVTMLWFNEPDSSQHLEGVGSHLGDDAVRIADEHFGTLISYLRSDGRLDDTDVLAVSDHGYSTSTGVVDIPKLVQEAGFAPGGELGGVVVATNGASVLFYVHESDEVTIDRLASWLMQHPWCGPVIASDAAGCVEGSLPASFIGLQGARAPDLAMSFAWDSRTNKAGYAGRSYAVDKVEGLGEHGSLSAHDIHNVFFARGPSFQSGVNITSPTGNADVAPTVLHALGLSVEDGMDGRVLTEALGSNKIMPGLSANTEIRRAERRFPSGVYRQEITVTSVGDAIYVEHGSGSLEQS